MKEQASRDAVKEIRLYNGYSADKSISAWLKEAEQIADLYTWTGEDKKRFIATRLKGPELTWHIHRIQNNAAEHYDDWQKALLIEFEHPADKDKLKIRLNNLKQEKDEQTKYFIGKIKSLYQAIYNEKVPDPPTATAAAQADPTKKLREDILLKVFMKGLLPHIRAEMFQRLKSNYDWYEATQAALDTEDLLISKELNEGHTVNSVAAISQPNDLLVLDHEQRLKDLEKKMTDVSLTQVGVFSGQPTDIAVISNSQYNRARTPQQGRENYSGRSFHYNNSNRGREYSREGARNYSNERNRPRSRGNSYDSKNNYTTQRNNSNNRGGYRQGNRERSRSFENKVRTSSQDRGQQQQTNNRSFSRQINTFNYERGNGTRRNDSPYPQKQVNFEACERCERPGHKAAECRTQNPRKFQQRN